jgi:uncharacterized protein (DUF58 family)
MKAQYGEPFWKRRALARLMKGSWRASTTYIVPSGLGVFFLLGCIVLFVFGALYRNDILYVHAFALLSLFFLAMIQTHGNVRRLSASLFSRETPLAGQNFAVVVRIENPARVGSTLLKVRMRPFVQSTTSQEIIQKNVSFPMAKVEAVREREWVDYAEGKETTSVPFLLKSLSRGKLPDFRVIITTRYPFGLFVAWRIFDGQFDGFVAPAAFGPMPLPYGFREGNSGQAAENTNEKKGPELEEPRGYTAGDSPRSILWRRYLPGKIPLVRQLRDENVQDLVLSWKATEPLGDVEARLGQMCAWLVECRRRSLLCAAHFPGFRSDSFQDADFAVALKTLALFPEQSIQHNRGKSDR